MQKRNPLLVMALTFFTGGIYGLFWLRSAKRALRARGAKASVSLWLLVGPLLILALLVFGLMTGLMASYADPTGHTLQTVQPWITAGAVLVYVLAGLYFAAAIYWFYWFCKDVEKATGGRLVFGLSFGLAILTAVTGLWFIWPGIIQDSFNKIR